MPIPSHFSLWRILPIEIIQVIEEIYYLIDIFKYNNNKNSITEK